MGDFVLPAAIEGPSPAIRVVLLQAEFDVYEKEQARRRGGGRGIGKVLL